MSVASPIRHFYRILCLADTPHDLNLLSEKKLQETQEKYMRAILLHVFNMPRYTFSFFFFIHTFVAP